MNVFVIYNPVAGLQKTNELQTIEHALDTQNIQYTLFKTEINKGPLKLLSKYNKNFDTILVAGGDGTLSEVVQGMQKFKIDAPIQIIPTGTTNELASNFIPHKSLETIVSNLFSGDILSIDVGITDQNDSVSYALSFGNFTEVTYRTPQKLKNLLGYKAYILFGFISFRRIKSYFMEIISSDRIIKDTFVFGVVSNTHSVGNVISFEQDTIEFDDGYYEVFLIKKPKSIAQLRDILKSLKNQNYDNDLFIQFKTDAIEFKSNKEIAWNHDGEFGGKSKTKKLNIIQKRLKIYQ